MKPIILDLCGGTGSWSKPYAESGDYEVIVVDPQEWRPDLEGTGTVRRFKHLKKPVHGILAAPPCTDFSSSGAWMWEKKGPERLLLALSIADACVRIVTMHRPKWWALENPVGRLRHYYGPPTYIFNPCDHGDPYTKKTLLWGDFNKPKRHPVEPVKGSWIISLSPGEDRQRIRSTTPPGFALDFFVANP